MSHKSKVSLNEQLRQDFFSRLAIGRSRDLDKRNGLDTKRLIYSWGSYKTYFKVGKRYLAWCKRQGFRCRTLADCRPYCDLWLQENTAYLAGEEICIDDCGTYFKFTEDDAQYILKDGPGGLYWERIDNYTN